MRRGYFKPYGINLGYEYNTYMNIGKDYGDAKDATKGWMLNLSRYFRKKLNKKQRKYAFCNTYTEWENHVINIVRKDLTNGRDLLHWLYKEKNDAERRVEIVKAILIPIYLLLFPTYSFFDIPEIYTKCVFYAVVLFVAIFLIKMIKKLDDDLIKVCFYNDMIAVVSHVLDEDK